MSGQTDVDPQICEGDPDGQTVAQALTVRRRRTPWLRRGIALTLLSSGVALGAVMVNDPEALDTPVGNAKVTVDRAFGEVAVAVGAGPSLGYTPDPTPSPDSLWSRMTGSGRSSYLPEVTLGGPGGEVELDACTGEFTEMVDHQAPGGPPLYSAHNTCDGDIILGWSIGQRATVAGSDVVYEVVEERQAMDYSDTGVLTDMPGEFTLQTCFYGESRMRFLALAPVDSTGA